MSKTYLSARHSITIQKVIYKGVEENQETHEVTCDCGFSKSLRDANDIEQVVLAHKIDILLSAALVTVEVSNLKYRLEEE